MPTSKVRLEIQQGTTWAHGWAVTFNGTPLDNTWTARGQIRARVVATEILHTFAASVNEDGSVVVAVEPGESSAWTWRGGVYDIEVENTDGVVLRVSEGVVAISPEVTR